MYTRHSKNKLRLPPGIQAVVDQCNQGRTQGGLGLNSPGELDINQNVITCAKEINCFRKVFAC